MTSCRGVRNGEPSAVRSDPFRAPCSTRFAMKSQLIHCFLTLHLGQDRKKMTKKENMNEKDKNERWEKGEAIERK
jgi:hypothetical protein